MGARVTFDDFCRVWPMRSESERVSAFAAFHALAPEKRAEAVHGADAYQALCKHCDITVAPAAMAMANGSFQTSRSLAMVEPRVRRLMRSAA